MSLKHCNIVIYFRNQKFHRFYFWDLADFSFDTFCFKGPSFKMLLLFKITFKCGENLSLVLLSASLTFNK